MSPDAMPDNQRARLADGPYFEDLERGQRFTAPSLTLTSGLAAGHQAVVGDRLLLSLDERLAEAVTGGAPVAHPALVWDVAIGQSTVVTRHVVANLFYRGLTLHRLPLIGDTLTTTTEVVGLRENRRRPGRRPTGLAALRITTMDGRGDLVLDFVRCAMIPLRDAGTATGRTDDIEAVAPPAPAGGAPAAVAGWNLAAFGRVAGVSGDRVPRPGQRWHSPIGDVVSGAPELARLTLNIGGVHHDAAHAGGRRLVYGGHTVGLALAQACRILPEMVTVTGWHGCDHTGPVREGDTLHSEVSVERVEAIPGGLLAHLRSLVWATGEGGPPRPVLDWRYTAVFAHSGA